MSDYQEAIQSPQICFTDPELSKATPVTNRLGLPRPICGNFASVYELDSGGHRWAVKCFLRNIPDLHKRYEKISDHLKGCGLAYFVTFEYQEQGIRVQGKLFPLVKMEWVEGMPLNEYISRRVSDRKALEELGKKWAVLLGDLRGAEIGHGDLQHGNVLVGGDGSLRLIDYDGMWVPKLRGQKTHETGHPDYQSPLRTQDDFDADVDAFAGEVIAVAIRALALRPALWQKYNNGDNLLFRRADYLNPSASPVFAELRGLGESDITDTLDTLIKACGGKGGAKRSAKVKDVKNVPATPASSAPAPRPKAPAAATARAPAAVGSNPGHSTPPAWNPRPAAGPAASGAARAASWLGDHVTTAVTPAAPPPPPPAPRLQPALQPPSPSSAPPAAAPARSKASPRPAAPKAKPKPAAPRPAARPAARPSRGGRGGVLGILCLLLHVVVLVPVAVLAGMQAYQVMGGRGDEATTILLPAFSTSTAIGAFSLLTMFVWRVVHAVVASLFFSLVGILMLLNMAAGLFAVRSYGLSGHELAECLLVLALLLFSGAGLLVEPACRR